MDQNKIFKKNGSRLSVIDFLAVFLKGKWAFNPSRAKKMEVKYNVIFKYVGSVSYMLSFEVCMRETL